MHWRDGERKKSQQRKSRKNHESCVMETKREKIFKKEGVVNNANSVVEKEQREFKHAENRYVVGRIDSESH